MRETLDLENVGFRPSFAAACWRRCVMSPLIYVGTSGSLTLDGQEVGQPSNNSPSSPNFLREDLSAVQGRGPWAVG